MDERLRLLGRCHADVQCALQRLSLSLRSSSLVLSSLAMLRVLRSTACGASSSLLHVS
jgi:hypothetical protein